MNRAPAFLLATVLIGPALAQTPDLALRWDIRGNYIATSGNSSRLRWYDPMGRPSTVGFGLTLEPGYYVLITQRLQRFEGDIDREQIDEAYIEDPGSWRIGRQYLPAGSKSLIREAALGARGELRLGKGLTATIMGFDNGRRSLRGGLVRLGSREIGLTVGYGRHFAAAATSLGALRSPQLRPGRGRGFKWVAGVDVTRGIGKALGALEIFALRDGMSPKDQSTTISDLRITNEFAEGQVEATFGWARDWSGRVDLYRIEGALKISKNVSLTSFVRFERGTWKDLAAGFRVRL